LKLRRHAACNAACNSEASFDNNLLASEAWIELDRILDVEGSAIVEREHDFASAM